MYICILYMYMYIYICTCIYINMHCMLIVVNHLILFSHLSKSYIVRKSSSVQKKKQVVYVVYHWYMYNQNENIPIYSFPVDSQQDSHLPGHLAVLLFLAIKHFTLQVRFFFELFH